MRGEQKVFVHTKTENDQSKKRRRCLIGGLLALAGLIFWIWWGNGAVMVTYLTVNSARLPQAFSGYRIAQVSDLHNTELGKDNQDLLALLAEADPDCIVMTGDMIDSYDTDEEVALRFAQAALEIAPVYYVTGNHEGRIPAYPSFAAKLEELGVVVLSQEQVLLERDGAQIVLAGIDDPSFLTGEQIQHAQAGVEHALQTLQTEQTGFGDLYTVLLAHRPELFDAYAQSGVDLVMCGHAHGGQFRLPGVGGLYAPGQGVFPDYDAGLYAQDGTQMVVSRGLGNSLFPFRMNNRPELVVVELQAGS